MAILKIARLGHPVLRKRSENVPHRWWKEPKSKEFLRDLVDTLHEYQGVGLAAPQVHVPIRGAVIEIASNPRYPEAPSHPLTVLINPKILSLSTKVEEDWEGCLSIPDMRGQVTRADKIVIESADEKGEIRKITASGFLARAIQHEIDHLDGKVFLDRMTDFSSLSYLEEYNRYHAQDKPS